ncbi:uncharacterized protein AB675_12159 [Cyphellophora attinorum]|uniref:Uncharacterized protein n=1 Tax=Cyphellophora attinorum TaxID=1664694 RepID=A0A0N0NKQ4_9EURO|nr:uncharacterized protein AB675_12159 [Phialophora attinorum]KPI38421.1 hypothetical protein AB675_12159 [Phialophora attinorum]
MDVDSELVTTEELARLIVDASVVAEDSEATAVSRAIVRGGTLVAVQALVVLESGVGMAVGFCGDLESVGIDGEGPVGDTLPSTGTVKGFPVEEAAETISIGVDGTVVAAAVKLSDDGNDSIEEVTDVPPSAVTEVSAQHSGDSAQVPQPVMVVTDGGASVMPIEVGGITRRAANKRESGPWNLILGRVDLAHMLADELYTPPTPLPESLL